MICGKYLFQDGSERELNDDEKADATEEVEMREAEREKSKWDEVDGVTEKAGSKGRVKNIKNSDQLFVEKIT